jgi:DNA-binding MarR family transcriptional regulator
MPEMSEGRASAGPRKKTTSSSFKERTGYLLSQVRALLRAELDAALTNKGITVPQYVALTTLEEDPCVSNAEMARLCFVTPQTMLRVVENLEEAGLVTRSPHPTHGRIRQIEFTPRGRKLVSECHQRVLMLEERMVAGLSKAERRQLFEMLRKCMKALGGRL